MSDEWVLLTDRLKTKEAIDTDMTQEDQSDDETEQCPECGSKDLLDDAKRAEIVCGDCGLVIEESQDNSESKWNSSDSDDRGGESVKTDIDWKDKDWSDEGFKQQLDNKNPPTSYNMEDVTEKYGLLLVVDVDLNEVDSSTMRFGFVRKGPGMSIESKEYAPSISADRVFTDFVKSVSSADEGDYQKHAHELDGEIYLGGEGGKRCPGELERNVLEGIGNRLEGNEEEKGRPDDYEEMLCELTVFWEGKTDFEGMDELDRSQIGRAICHVVESETIDSIQGLTSLCKNVMKQPVAKSIEYAVEQLE